MYIPKEIMHIIKDQSYTIDLIGMSDSSILLFEDYVLKIQPYTPEAMNELVMMNWLEGKINVPKIICFVLENNTTYFLMSRIKGLMACDISYLENSNKLVTLLVEGLKSLWSVPIENCPSAICLDKKLEMAKTRVEHNLVDIEECDPNTFGPNGFETPLALYQWLVENKPKEELVLSHGDFCLPNIFNHEGSINFIDIGRMGISDPWQDIALCYRSLRDNMNGSFGGKVYDFNPELLFEKLGIEKDEAKLNYYLLLDELF